MQMCIVTEPVDIGGDGGISSLGHNASGQLQLEPIHANAAHGREYSLLCRVSRQVQKTRVAHRHALPSQIPVPTALSKLLRTSSINALARPMTSRLSRSIHTTVVRYPLLQLQVLWPTSISCVPSPSTAPGSPKRSIRCCQHRLGPSPNSPWLVSTAFCSCAPTATPTSYA
jgi:hypothetical protein